MMPRMDSAASDRRIVWVVAAGLATSAGALAAVFALARHGTNLMGMYADYVLPWGALLVGVVASSGYGIAAWRIGCKLGKGQVWLVVGLLAASYLGAQYVEYRHELPGGGLGFWAWFDAVTRAFAWDKSFDGTAGSALGGLGYGLRALEIAGFVGGGVVVPLALRRKPYCHACRSFRRTRRLALIPGGHAGDDAAREALSSVLAAAGRGDRAGFERKVARSSVDRRRLGAASRIALDVVRCPRCGGGSLTAQHLIGSGQHLRVTPLATQALEPPTAHALFD